MSEALGMSTMSTGRTAEVERPCNEVTVYIESVSESSTARTARENPPDAASRSLRFAARAQAEGRLVKSLAAASTSRMKDDSVLCETSSSAREDASGIDAEAAHLGQGSKGRCSAVLVDGSGSGVQLKTT